MHGQDFLQALKDRGIEPLNNNDVAEQMSSGYETAALKGNQPPSGAFVDAMPDVSASVGPNTSVPSFDIKGLGFT